MLLLGVFAGSINLESTMLSNKEILFNSVVVLSCQLSGQQCVHFHENLGSDNFGLQTYTQLKNENEAKTISCR